MIISAITQRSPFLLQTSFTEIKKDVLLGVLGQHFSQVEFFFLSFCVLPTFRNFLFLFHSCSPATKLPAFIQCVCVMWFGCWWICFLYFSAGAGRTGTFIALSNILERVKAEGLLDVFQTVKSLRMQRPHMVQTVVGGKEDDIKAAVYKLFLFVLFWSHFWTFLHTNTFFLFLLLSGTIRLLLQSGSGFCRHLLWLRQF